MFGGVPRFLRIQTCDYFIYMLIYLFVLHVNACAFSSLPLIDSSTESSG